MLASRAIDDSFGTRLAATVVAIKDGHYRAARTDLSELEPAADVGELLRIAECYTHIGRHDDAGRCCALATARAPDDGRAIYALAAANIATGATDAAKRLFDRLIAAQSNEWDAWANRSTLQTATIAANHIEPLERALQSIPPENTDARVALGYALAKELEDLGEHDRAFIHLSQAARARRQRLSYRVDEDVATMAAIMHAFDSVRMANVPASSNAPGPIFILGLPRSGTTLVDRILSSHPRVTSLGEIQDFALSLIGLNPQARSKDTLIVASALMDHAALGAEYSRRIAEHEPGTELAIDKTPLNFLYIGLIALALPNARVVHVRRGAMDGCYAMFKTLFRMGYPFSYDLSDLAAYRIAYSRMMDHWRSVLPGRMIEIDYEALVADQRRQSQRLVAACGLEWDDACLAFERNPAPVATASAVQVRAPIHDRSVGLWRPYADGLSPLAAALAAANVPLEYEA